MIELVRPTVDLAASWWVMVDAFEGQTIQGSSFRPADGDRLRAPGVFEVWVDWLAEQARDDVRMPEGRVACSYRWIVEGDRVVGTLALRHDLNDALLVVGGHLGYAVEPGWRRRGVATAAVRLALAMAAARGLDPVLITCDSDNVASARTIEKVGGVWEDDRAGSRRYWVSTGTTGPAVRHPE